MTKKKLREYAIPIIERIAQHRRRNVFAYYDSNDVKQEIWVLCLQALDKFDPTKVSPGIPIKKQIEHFLNNHVSNRMKNLKRDKYFRPQPIKSGVNRAKIRMDLVNALPLDICETKEGIIPLGSASRNHDPVSHSLAKETIEFIEFRLPPHLKTPFIDLLSGNKVSNPTKIKLQELIKEILSELNDE